MREVVNDNMKLSVIAREAVRPMTRHGRGQGGRKVVPVQLPTA